jgi:methyl-accepting chemotaxis protein
MASFATRRTLLADRFGIVPRLLVCSLLAIMVTVAAVETWTLRLVDANGIQRAQDALQQSMSLLRLQLSPLGSQWTATADGKLLLGSTPLNGRNDIVDAVRDVTGAVATVFLGDTRIATNVKNPDGSRGVGTRLATGPARDAVLRDGRTYRGKADILGGGYLTVYEPIRDSLGQTIGILFVGVPLADAQAFVTTIVRHATAGALAIAALASLAYFWVLRATVRPLRELTTVMDHVAEGALGGVVPCTTRSDEIGVMARALQQLQEVLLRARSVETAAAEQRQRAAAEKLTALVAMAETVERETAVALDHFDGQADAMKVTAEAMSASAHRTGAASGEAAAAAAQARTNAQTVAAAAEQLSASIREIGSQVSQSTTVVRRAVQAGTQTRTTIETLNEKVGRIGLVADMIGEIAAKTNLLALNATIEAARAGDAGKGFAVVASEVKQLATQTARSTEEISRHIAEVKTATGESVTQVAHIEQTITEINAIASSIATAIEEQGAATTEIARNVAETANAAHEMTQRTSEVSGEAEHTGAQAGAVLDGIRTLKSAMAELRHSVIRVVRASAPEVDRRQSERYRIDIRGRISGAGIDTQDVQIVDVSEYGAAIKDGGVLRPHATGTLDIEGIGQRLTFVTRDIDSNGVAHLAFDQSAREALRTLLLRIPSRQAA